MSYCLRVFVNRVGMFAIDKCDVVVDAVVAGSQNEKTDGGRQDPRLAELLSALSNVHPSSRLEAPSARKI